MAMTTVEEPVRRHDSRGRWFAGTRRELSWLGDHAAELGKLMGSMIAGVFLTGVLFLTIKVLGLLMVLF